MYIIKKDEGKKKKQVFNKNEIIVTFFQEIYTKITLFFEI